MNAAVYDDAETAGVWVNSADDIEHCSFTLPAIHRDGAVTIDPNGGVGDIQFGAGISSNNLIFESDNASGDLKIGRAHV